MIKKFITITFKSPAKPPKFELEGKKWVVEYHKNNPSLVIEETETNQSVYVFKCEGSTLKVEGKVNNIIVDGCKKCAVVFTDCVSSCEFINCQSVQMQVQIFFRYFSQNQNQNNTESISPEIKKVINLGITCADKLLHQDRHTSI